jgi:hypothetical protein
MVTFAAALCLTLAACAMAAAARGATLRGDRDSAARLDALDAMDCELAWTFLQSEDPQPPSRSEVARDPRPVRLAICGISRSDSLVATAELRLSTSAIEFTDDHDGMA